MGPKQCHNKLINFIPALAVKIGVVYCCLSNMKDSIKSRDIFFVVSTGWRGLDVDTERWWISFDRVEYQVFIQRSNWPTTGSKPAINGTSTGNQIYQAYSQLALQC